MELRFVMNVRMHQTMVQELGLKSDYFETFLIKTERFLRTNKGQRALTYLKKEISKHHYRGVVDAVLAVASPSWRKHVLHYYEHGGAKLGHAVTYAQIEEIDKTLFDLLRELSDLAGEGCPESGLVLSAYVHFAGGRIPEAPPPGMGAAAA